jgi:hypothetical protein
MRSIAECFWGGAARSMENGDEREIEMKSEGD